MNAPVTHDGNLARLTKLIRVVNEANGWHETERTIDESEALLHSEIAEAFEAWRDHGFEDQTHRVSASGALAKPEGVGSELADTLIRLLDMVDRHEDIRPYWTDRDINDVTPHPVSMVGESFPSQVAHMHRVAALGYYSSLLPVLLGVAREAGIDLLDETYRKIAFNRTRGYRHGGKRI